MSVAVPESGERIEKSLGMLIKAAFTEKDFFSVVGLTEIPAKAIHPMVMLMTNQRIMEILSTPDPDEIEFGDTELAALRYEEEMDKYRIRQAIENDPKAMQSAILYGYTYFYALCQRSRDRKGRAEGVKISAGASAQEEAEGVGLSQKLLHSLGLGQLTKYKKVYVDKS
jgi:hypothetical protein